jgi:hypothetical protein
MTNNKFSILNSQLAPRYCQSSPIQRASRLIVGGAILVFSGLSLSAQNKVVRLALIGATT